MLPVHCELLCHCKASCSHSQLPNLFDHYCFMRAGCVCVSTVIHTRSALCKKTVWPKLLQLTLLSHLREQQLDSLWRSPGRRCSESHSAPGPHLLLVGIQATGYVQQKIKSPNPVYEYCSPSSNIFNIHIWSHCPALQADTGEIPENRGLLEKQSSEFLTRSFLMLHRLFLLLVFCFVFVGFTWVLFGVFCVFFCLSVFWGFF